MLFSAIRKNESNTIISVLISSARSYSQEDIFRDFDINEILREMGFGVGGGAGRGGSLYLPRQRSFCRSLRTGAARHYQTPQKGRTFNTTSILPLKNPYSARKETSSPAGQQVNEINVKIPAGISTGKKLRLSGKGNPGIQGGPAGDLYLNINVVPHPIFARDGNDIYIEKSIPLPKPFWERASMFPRLTERSRGSRFLPGTKTGQRSG